MRRLGPGHATELAVIHPVMDGQAGLLFVDGAYVETLGGGRARLLDGRPYGAGRRSIDLKRQSLDVAGQEVLTKDRVTIRVNIAAEYRVVDPLKAVSAVKDFSEALYRALQYAFRKTLEQPDARPDPRKEGHGRRGGRRQGADRHGRDRGRGVRHFAEGRDPARRNARDPEPGRVGRRSRRRPTSSAAARRRTPPVRCSTRPR